MVHTALADREGYRSGSLEGTRPPEELSGIAFALGPYFEISFIILFYCISFFVYPKKIEIAMVKVIGCYY